MGRRAGLAGALGALVTVSARHAVVAGGSVVAVGAAVLGIADIIGAWVGIVTGRVRRCAGLAGALGALVIVCARHAVVAGGSVVAVGAAVLGIADVVGAGVGIVTGGVGRRAGLAGALVALVILCARHAVIAERLVVHVCAFAGLSVADVIGAWVGIVTLGVVLATRGARAELLELEGGHGIAFGVAPALTLGGIPR